MHISGEGKLALLVGLLGVAGAGAIMVAPDQFWIGWSLLGLAVVGAIVLGCHHATEKGWIGRRPMAISLMVLGCALFFAGAVWLGIASHKKSGEIFAGPSDPLDNKIGFNCYPAPRPTRGREDKPLYWLQIIEPGLNKDAPRAMGVSSFPPGVDPRWGEGISPEWAVRCVLTNYGDSPFFGVSVPLSIEWRENVKIEFGSRSGEVVATQSIRSPQLDIGSGAHNEDFFYIMNFSLFWVHIATPDTVSLRQAGSAETKTAKLIPPNMRIPMSLQPNPYRKPAPTAPPTEAAPSPTPPEQPEKK